MILSYFVLISSVGATFTNLGLVALILLSVGLLFLYNTGLDRSLAADRCKQLLKMPSAIRFLLSWRDADCREFLPTPLRLYIQTTTLLFT